MRRRARRVPDTAQRSLGWSGTPEAEGTAGATKKIRRWATGFHDATPWHLYVGDERLDQYLTARGLGWVVRLREELQAVDVGDLEANYTGTGRAPYHPRLMIGLIVYGTLKRKATLRELEELAVADVGAWWICGGEQPDHSTIGNFLVRHQQEISREFFLRLVHDLVGRKGITNGVVAGDATVIEAVTSRFSMLSQEAAEQAAAEAEQAVEQHPDDPGITLAAQQAKGIATVARQRAGQPGRRGKKKSAWIVAPREPEAVMQQCKDGRQRPSYKPSVLVHECGLIVSQGVEASCDSAAIPDLLEQYDGVVGAAPRTLLLDAGYHGIDLLRELAAREIDVLCPSGNPFRERWKRQGRQGKFGKTDFAYDAATDRYRCPAGHWLVPAGTYYDPQKGRAARKYRARQCWGCALRARCTHSQQGRALERYEGEEFKEAMEQVMAHPAAKRRYRRRKAIVERVFAELIRRQGLQRFRRRGLLGSALEFSLHCIAFNLKWALRARPFRRVFALVRSLRRSWCLRLIWAQPHTISRPDVDSPHLLAA
jgi:transposase